MYISAEVWATIVGALIAGLIGILTLFVAQEIQGRRELNEAILGPAFDSLLPVPKRWPWRGPLELPWEEIPPHRWLAVPRKYRVPLNGLAQSAKRYNDALGNYFQFMGSGGWDAYKNDVRSAMQKYIVSGGSLNPISLGIGTSPLDVQPIAAGLAPAILLSPNDPGQVCKTLRESPSDITYWARELAEALRTKDPPTLSAICDAIAHDPLSARAGELVKEVESEYKQVVAKAAACKILLASRLGVKDVS